MDFFRSILGHASLRSPRRRLPLVRPTDGGWGRCSDSQQVPLITESRSFASVRIGTARCIRADRPSILGGCPARLFSSSPQPVHFFFFFFLLRLHHLSWCCSIRG